MTTGGAGDGYIPARRGELLAAIAAEAGAHAGQLESMAKLLSAIFHAEARGEIDALKALYDPLDPAQPDPRHAATAAAQDAFERGLIAALDRANYTEIAADSAASKATKALVGVGVTPSSAGVSDVRYFGRGARPGKIDAKTLLGLRRVSIDTITIGEVIVLANFCDDSRSRDRAALKRLGVRPGAVVLKHFRDTTAPELVLLHPGVRSENPRVQRYLASTLYFRNLASNAGVLDLLIGAGEEQDCKEALVAYWILTKNNAQMGRGELDLEAERFLFEQLKLDVNFEIHDALEKLARLGLVSVENEHCRAVPLNEAIARLDAVWDGQFKRAELR